jgi:hypothetical protein
MSGKVKSFNHREHRGTQRTTTEPVCRRPEFPPLAQPLRVLVSPVEVVSGFVLLEFAFGCGR